MVIGYHPPAHFSPAHNGGAPLGSKFLAPPTNSSHHHRKHGSQMAFSRDDDDVLSLESSDPDSFSSHGSASEKKQAFSRSNSGPTSPNHKGFPQLKSRDPLPTSPLRSGDVPLETPGSPSRSCDPEVAPPPFGSGDYTSKIRYPNNSRILVQPLLDEDISLKGGSAGGQRPPLDPPAVGGGSNKEPFFCDRSHFNMVQPGPSSPQKKRQGRQN